MGAKTLLKVHDSIRDFFEFARWDWRKDEKFTSQLRCKRLYDNTDGGDGFYGNQEKVYEKYATHKVEKESSLVNDVMGEFKSLEFDEVKWKFAQRLVEGDSVDVNRYLDGHEKCWLGVKKQRKRKKVVRIYSEFGGHCGRSANELAVNGAMAVTLCEILESMGIGVELWACTYAKYAGYNGIDILEMVKVKASDEFADLGMINYVTGNNHVFRNTAFRNWGRILHENNKGDLSWGLGHHGNLTMEILEGRQEDKADGTILIPSIYDVEKAKRWMIDLLKKNEIITGDK